MKQARLLFYIGVAVVLLVSSCKKEFSFEKAAGSLKDSTGQCFPIIISGTYHQGRSLLPDSFYILVEVNVTKTGVYTIQTNSSNGFMFAGSGKFTANGIQKVKLRPTGLPLNDTLTRFNCYFDNSVCTFSINVKDSTRTSTGPQDMTLNTWQFTDKTNGSFHHGIIDKISTWFQTNAAWNYLNIMGWPGSFSAVNHDTLFHITLYLPAPVIDTGTYTINSGTGADHFFGYANNKFIGGNGNNQFFCYYLSNPLITPDFIFRITSRDRQKKTVKGIFYGTSRRREDYSDYLGTGHTISGSFYFQLD